MTEKKQKHPHIELCDCESSQITAHGYDAATKTMALRFKTGATYHYPDVTPDEFAAFKGAKSLGKHFSQHLRARKCVKL